ncbi:carboxymuconolactone decarboxylase [Oleiphilus sp. HI0009]|uniref:carboxymuconolactone decarboxylase family protein n=2 Tax=Oleiphilus sp. HI0125 TaxID=1822266 RepID=UPI0007C3B3FD|nr:carboxymuconolactone decarboxylase family protein [Oleiphilus sp. HI0125]KZX75437.1 carboxymuconolactone decarboxylase [Oleiphilus sp. HI0009]KZX83154.1 carboxymuconolactone decarboxylase [Oleiphilus sp. HI0009]KZZ59265.1 carboxymuconolactone decarboxylase [Oleiphilus sp. HI0125]
MFTYYETNTAPEESKSLMEASLKGFGMIPNLHKILAEAPATYEAYNTVFNLFMKNTTLSPIEQQVVFMTANFENNCHYCVPGHTWMMHSAKMPEEVIEALREGTEIPDAKLQALHDYAKALLDKRGHIGDEKLQDFIEAGYTKRQALEVLTGLSAKLISNFTNALAHTEPDDAFKKYAWIHPSQR